MQKKKGSSKRISAFRTWLTGKTTWRSYSHGDGRSLAYGLEHVVEELLRGRLVEIEGDLIIEKNTITFFLQN